MQNVGTSAQKVINLINPQTSDGDVIVVLFLLIMFYLQDLPSTTGLDASDLTKLRALTAGGVVQNASTSGSPLVFTTNTSNTDTTRRTQLSNIDLNNEYDGSQDCLEDLPDTFARKNLGDMSPAGPLWLYKDSQRSSPPQNSGNSGSTSSQSPSTSSGETQVSS